MGVDMLEDQIGVPIIIKSYEEGFFFISLIAVNLLKLASAPALKNPGIPFLFLVSKISSLSHFKMSEIVSATFLVFPLSRIINN